MATEVKLPRLGQGMESGTIVRWLKAEGDAVKKREPLYELDTDKVTQEVEAEADGVLLKIVVAGGRGRGRHHDRRDRRRRREDVSPSRQPSRRLAATGAASPGVGARAGGSLRAPPAPTAADATPLPAEPPRAAGRRRWPSRSVAAPSARGRRRVKATPLARRIARERGVDLASVVGNGPDGRIVAEDVEKAAAAPAAAAAGRGAALAEVEVVQLTSVRKTIARRLTEAWAAPVFQLGVSRPT